MTAAEEQEIVNGLVRQVINSLGERDPASDYDQRAIVALESFMVRSEKVTGALRRAAERPCSYFEEQTCVDMGFITMCASCEARSALADIDDEEGEEG